MAEARGAEGFHIHVAARGVAEPAGGGEIGGAVGTAFGARNDVIERGAAPAFALAIHRAAAPAAAAVLGGDQSGADFTPVHRLRRTGGMRILS